jgi:hypothetical protein
MSAIFKILSLPAVLKRRRFGFLWKVAGSEVETAKAVRTKYGNSSPSSRHIFDTMSESREREV